jgi:TonB family protein
MQGLCSLQLCISTVAAAFLLAGCPPARLAAPVPSVQSATASPSPIAPPDQSVFTNFPRTIHFRWSSVPEKASYALEIDCQGCCASGRWCSDVQGRGYIVANLRQSEYEFNFWGNQEGRWRVWAVDAKSQPGPKSPWSSFLFVSPGNANRTAPFSNPVPSGQSSDSPDTVYSAGPGVVVAKAIYSPAAQYSDAARKARIRGDVLLEAVIAADGTVREARVIRPLNPDLDANALRALKTWRFEPATKDGKAVAIRSQISMSFNVQ